MAEWKLNGNTGTNPTQDFLGTTDYQPLVIKTDGLERLRVSSDPSGEGVVMVHSNLTVDSSSGICLKANAAHPDDPGDMVFLAANGDQKARVWSHPGTAKGLHLSGSDNNPKLTIDENGNLIIGGNANINSPGRMHIAGEELLYLLNKSGVTVSQAWGGNGNLTVEGDLEIGATMRSPGRMHIAGEELLYLLNKSGVIVSQAWGGNGNLTVENDLNVGNNISVNGDITLQNADVAERFEVIDPMAAEPGVVMVLDDEGSLAMSERAYDRRVAGVVSGAGSYRPGIVLDGHDRPGQIAIALVGKVFCKVDASLAPIAVGDLLTTSTTPGHAMKALDRDLAFGATLGKALKPLSTGKGMIPTLVALQ